MEETDSETKIKILTVHPLADKGSANGCWQRSQFLEAEVKGAYQGCTVQLLTHSCKRAVRKPGPLLSSWASVVNKAHQQFTAAPSSQQDVLPLTEEDQEAGHSSQFARSLQEAGHSSQFARSLQEAGHSSQFARSLQEAGHSSQFCAAQSPPLSQEGTTCGAPMESTLKKWVMQPFSPKLEPTDLRGMVFSNEEQSFQDNAYINNTREDLKLTFVSSQPSVTVTSQDVDSSYVLVQAKKVVVSGEVKNKDQDPISPTSASSDSSIQSPSGFYSFVEEESDPEAERTRVWMVSPERQSNMTILKEENSFKLQAYSEKRKPEKMFQDSNEDSRYRITDDLYTEEEDQEQAQDRLQIIRSQAPKKSTAFTEQCGSLESLDLSSIPQSVSEESSLCYSPSTAEQEHAGARSSGIDTENISFDAARQQFLRMEQYRSNPFWQDSQQLFQSKHQSQSSATERGMLSKEDEQQLNKSQNVEVDAIRNDLFGSKGVKVYTSEENTVKSCPSDSLSSLGYLPTSLSEHDTFHNEASNTALGKVSISGLPSSGETETPIEREIRIAQEREENLRRERGIKHTDVNEMVEIKTRPLHCQKSPSAMPVKTKEKSRVSFFVQREIQLESQRDQKLYPQGRVPGLYDQVQELEASKKVFDQQVDQVPVMPKMSFIGNLTEAAQTKVGVEDGTLDREHSYRTENVLSPCCPHRHPDDRILHISSGGGFLDLSTQDKISRTPQFPLYLVPEERISVIANAKNRSSASQSSASSANAVTPANDMSRLAARKESISVSNYSSYNPSPDTSYSLSSTPTEQCQFGPPWARKPVLNRSGSHDQFNLRPRKMHTPEAILREIEQDLKREEELRLLREAAGLSLTQDDDLDEVDRTVPSIDIVEHNKLKTSTNDTSVFLKMKEKSKEEEKLVSTPAFEGQTEETRGFNSIQAPSAIATDKPTAADTCPQLVHTPARFLSASIVTAQPWSSPKLSSTIPTKASAPKAQAGVSVVQKGLTESLLNDFKDMRVRQRLEEGAYAGIQPTDDVNSEVVGATRVTRHKSTRALQWEAGLFANRESE